MFCNECGKNIENLEICPYCGYGKKNEYLFIHPAKKWYNTEKITSKNISRSIAGLLQLFTGALGLGRFYMKSYRIAVLQILLTLLTFGVGGFLWGVIDGLMILSGKIVLDGTGEIMGV